MNGLTLSDTAFVGAVAGEKNGLTLITWAHAVWAGDSKWTNPGDGNPVTSMRNSTGGGDPANTGSNRPTYRSSVAAYNNKPAIQFVSASSQYLDFDVTNISQTYSLVIIGNTSGANGSAERLVGTGAQANGGTGDSAGNAFFTNFGTSLVGPTCDANPHLHRSFANGNSSVYGIDGTTVASGAAGANSFQRFTIGASSTSTPAYTSFLNGYIAFVGIAAGDVSAQAGWAAFKAWVASEYALTIA